MAINISTSANIDDIVQTMIAEAKFTIAQKVIFPGLVRTYTMEKGHDTISIPKWGTVSVADLTEGVDMVAPQQISTSATNFTTGEVGGQIIITDVMKFKGMSDVNRAAGRQLGDAMAKKQDRDISGLLDDFTVSLGAYNTTFAPGYITAGYSRLIAADEPAPDPIICALHPYHVKDLLDAFVNVAATYNTVTGGLGAELTKTGFQGLTKLYSIPLYVSGNLSATSQSTGYYGAIFSKEAIVLVKEKEWNIETERNASLRADELNIVSRYGKGIYNAGWGFGLLFDATAPAS